MFSPSAALVDELVAMHGTPLFVYSRSVLRSQAAKALGFRRRNLICRYAMKANPHPETLRELDAMGLHLDASSEYEVYHALRAGIAPQKIALNSQQLPRDLAAFVKENDRVFFTATSLHQLEEYGKIRPGSTLGIRLNPGFGSGASNRVTTGGSAAGFGIWHEYIPQAKELAEKYRLHISKIHTHIGAGTDPERWKKVASITLNLVRQFPAATCVSLGGGFKVARMDDEVSADLVDIGHHVEQLLDEFQAETGRDLQLEIEPGSFLTAQAGVLLSRVVDLTDTGADGYRFIRLDTGMNDILRPTMYGALHMIRLYPRTPQQESFNYVVIGHNCESGDLLTPVRGNSEQILPRLLPKASIGDLVSIQGAGAYCASMRARGYNMFPDAPEIFVE